MAARRRSQQVQQRYEWVVTDAAGEHLAGGYEDDKARAIELVDEHAEQLRSDGTSGWYAGVMDMTKPILSHDPLMLSYRLVYLVDA
jgi:hypothetical protein